MAALLAIHGSDDDDFIDPFHIKVLIHAQYTAYNAFALIDSTTDYTVLSYEVWDALG